MHTNDVDLENSISRPHFASRRATTGGPTKPYQSQLVTFCRTTFRLLRMNMSESFCSVKSPLRDLDTDAQIGSTKPQMAS